MAMIDRQPGMHWDDVKGWHWPSEAEKNGRMTPNDTKPEKAEASAVRPLTAAEAFADAKLAVGYLYRQGEEAFTGYLDARAYQEGKKAAALQSSSSAEAERHALRAENERLRSELDEAGKTLDAARLHVTDDLSKDILQRAAIRACRAALNHGKGEDARAASTKDQGDEHGE